MKPSNEKPSASEFGLLRAYLATNGVSQATINERIPAGAHATMTRADIVAEMKAMCQSFPKAA